MFGLFRTVPRRSPRSTRRASFRPRVEALEDRAIPSVTTLKVSPNPVPAGQTITLVAIVEESGGDQVQPGTGLTGGLATFFDGPTQLSTVGVKRSNVHLDQGVALLTTSALGGGTHSLTAQYSGDESLGSETAGSTSNAVSVVVNLPPLMDVTAQVSITAQKRFPGNRVLVTVTNTGGQTLQAPLYLVFTHLPKKVHVLGPSGRTQMASPIGSPFLEDDVTLLPAGFVNFLIAFRGAGGRRVLFTAEVLAGPPSEV